MADPIVNFFSSTLVGGYSDTDTSLTLATGSGANLPDPSVDGEFNLVIYNESEIFVTTTFDGGSTDTRQDLASTNPEIVRVTARSGDVITVTRAQEGTTASAKAAENTYRVILASTKKVFDDINTAIANVNVTNLTGVEELTFDSTGDEEFGLPAGTTAQRPSSPSAGYMRYNTETAKLEIYSGGVWGLVSLDNVRVMQTAQLSVTANDAVAENIIPLEVEYLVIAGGGGGGNTGNLLRDGAGGAGGYRSSVSGESSGGGASAESIFEPELSTSYTVTIGAGGSSANGSNSVFNTITSIGGGKGGGGGSGNDGSSGGSGGGECGGGGSAGQTGQRASGTTGQGFDGGIGSSPGDRGGNGGGAGQQGADAPTQSVASGVSSSITGTSVERAKGGAVGSSNSGGSNTGTGGDCQGNGGSGVVILRYPSAYTISVGAGLTASTSTVGANKVTTFTAGTDTISFS